MGCFIERGVGGFGSS